MIKFYFLFHQWRSYRALGSNFGTQLKIKNLSFLILFLQILQIVEKIEICDTSYTTVFHIS
jgi:hypothetical protein